MIHLGGHAAVVVPLADFLRLRALEVAASQADIEDAEDGAALHEWRQRQATGHARSVPASEVRTRLGVDHEITVVRIARAPGADRPRG